MAILVCHGTMSNSIENNMKQLKFVFLGLVIIAGGIGAGYYLMQNAPEPVMQTPEAIIPQVPFADVRIDSQAIPVFSRGRVQAASVHKIASQVSGLVTDLHPELKKRRGRRNRSITGSGR